uniref:Uncharacterized protein n=1 Tax=Globodera pallida TaxID=36090 RepID=A0A183C2N1_GLOPA
MSNKNHENAKNSARASKTRQMPSFKGKMAPLGDRLAQCVLPETGWGPLVEPRARLAMARLLPLPIGGCIRSSIPELVEEAKRFVWGGRLKSLPRGARTRGGGGVNGGSTTAPISEETMRKDMRGSNSSVGVGVSNQRPKQPSAMDRPTIAIVSELSGTMLAMAKQHTAVEKRQSVTIRNHPGIEEKLELSPTSPLGAQHQRLSPTSVYITHQHQQQRGDEDELQRRTPQLEPPTFPGFFAKGPLFASLSAPNRLKNQNLVSVQAVLGWWTDDN